MNTETLEDFVQRGQKAQAAVDEIIAQANSEELQSEPLYMPDFIPDSGEDELAAGDDIYEAPDEATAERICERMNFSTTE